MALTHEAIIVVPDDATYPVGTDEWNAAHLFTGGAAVQVLFQGAASAISSSASLAWDDTTKILTVLDSTDVNTKIGYQAGLNIVAGAQFNTFVGYQAGLSSAAGSTAAADNNTAIGYLALTSNTTADNNTAVGASALKNNTTGVSNVAIGASALLSNTTDTDNVAVGWRTLPSNTTGVS